MSELLKLGKGNAKLGKTTIIHDLPAGWTCCGSKDCNEKVDPKTGKLIQNPKAKFRCFAATSELISAAARRKRWYNFELLKACKTEQEMAELIVASIKAHKNSDKAPLVRVHSSGDFYNQKYFNAWMLVAKLMPEKLFYAYTKSLKFWVNDLTNVPNNFFLTASRGSTHDELIKKHNLKSVRIVFSEEEAVEKGLKIDHDDSLMFATEIKEFALLIHGTQPKASDASLAISALRKKGIMGYNRGKIGKGRTINSPQTEE